MKRRGFASSQIEHAARRKQARSESKAWSAEVVRHAKRGDCGTAVADLATLGFEQGIEAAEDVGVGRKMNTQDTLLGPAIDAVVACFMRKKR
jgi:hypothetical protein